MVTDRYFAIKANKEMVVWDRGKNEMVEKFPDTPTGRKKAETLRDDRNAQVRARNEPVRD